MIQKRFRSIGSLVTFRAALAATGALICTASCPARSEAAVTVLPQGSVVNGESIAQYTASWWDWALAFSTTPADPFSDTTGAYANLNQSGPVYFLAGNEGGSTSRIFNVPANKYLLVPLLVGEESQLELGAGSTESDVRSAAVSQANLIDSLEATIDGTGVPNLFSHRETSPDFTFQSAMNNPIGDPVGYSGIAVSDGYWLMLAPLSAGSHSLEFGGGISSYDYSIDATDKITAVPEPTSIAMLGIAGGAVLIRRRRTA